jgi:hypothetical protein
VLTWALSLLVTFAPPAGDDAAPDASEGEAVADATPPAAPEVEEVEIEIGLVGEPTDPQDEARDEATPSATPEPPSPEPEPAPEGDDARQRIAPEHGPEHGPPPSRIAPRRNHRLWAAPLSSTFVPGTGQFINGQPGKGMAILFTTVGSMAGAIALYSAENDGTRPVGAEYARLVGYGLLSSAAPMLWIYAIADAYRGATGKAVESRVDHKVRLSVGRTMTVGFRADPRRPGFYDDWSVAVMGQAARRLTLGVSDLSVKPGDAAMVWQFGLRIDYRVFEHARLWINLGVGTAMQVISARALAGLDPDVALPPNQLSFGATPYGHMDLRIFVLDRLSLDLIPRLSVPVTTRYFSADRALPRFAPSLELGTGISAYF